LDKKPKTSTAFVTIGNSQTLLWDGRSRFLCFPTLKLPPQKVLRFLKSFDEVYAVSVVPRASKKLRKLCPSIRAILVKDLGASFAYQKGLGIDRALNVLAARDLNPHRASMTIDCGTALTVDFINKKGRHLGGWIAAGPRILSQALLEKTAQLPRVDLSAWVFRTPIRRALGKSTRQSLAFGQRAQFEGFIEFALRRALKIFPREDFQVFLTGGGAALWSPTKPLMRRIPHLGLRGLQIFVQNKRR